MDAGRPPPAAEALRRHHGDDRMPQASGGGVGAVVAHDDGRSALVGSAAAYRLQVGQPNFTAQRAARHRRCFRGRLLAGGLPIRPGGRVASPRSAERSRRMAYCSAADRERSPRARAYSSSAATSSSDRLTLSCTVDRYPGSSGVALGGWCSVCKSALLPPRRPKVRGRGPPRLTVDDRGAVGRPPSVAEEVGSEQPGRRCRGSQG